MKLMTLVVCIMINLHALRVVITLIRTSGGMFMLAMSRRCSKILLRRRCQDTINCINLTSKVINYQVYKHKCCILHRNF